MIASIFSVKSELNSMYSDSLILSLLVKSRDACTVVREIAVPFRVKIQYDIRSPTLRETPSHLPIRVSPKLGFSLSEI